MLRAIEAFLEERDLRDGSDERHAHLHEKPNQEAD